MYHTFSFSAFNTTVAGTIDCGEHVDTQKATQLEQDIEAHAYAFEKICSRFDPASELSQLHASGAGTHTVSPILLRYYNLWYFIINRIALPCIGAGMGLENSSMDRSLDDSQSRGACRCTWLRQIYVIYHSRVTYSVHLSISSYHGRTRGDQFLVFCDPYHDII